MQMILYITHIYIVDIPIVQMLYSLNWRTQPFGIIAIEGYHLQSFSVISVVNLSI